MKLIMTTSAFAIAVTTALCTPALAAALPTSGSAAEVVTALQDQGYSVQFNGTLMMRMDPNNPGVAYVDLSCPVGN